MASPHKTISTAPGDRKKRSLAKSSATSPARGEEPARWQRCRCAACKKWHKVRMRRADAARADVHLLEELAKPRACVTGCRITVWVYRDGPTIREIVLSGHAEKITCGAATSRIMEAAKQLPDEVEWMLTCGAAYFRLPLQAAAPPDFDSIVQRMMSGQWNDPTTMLRAFAEHQEGNPQAVLGEMLRALAELSEESGLVEIIERDWRSLERFRQNYRQRAGAAAAEIVLPSPNSPGLVADFLPIVPTKNGDGKPLIFEFEGWDFDCPEFQLVADIHLRKVQRELLRDALRRRLIYRGWLQEWTEEWVPKLHALPKYQAGDIILSVPPVDYTPASDPIPVKVIDFLKSHAASFIDKSQKWPISQASLYQEIPFDQLSSAELDQQIRPNKIIEVDFERGSKTSRDANETDRSFSLRERLLINDPQMISQCLLWIRRMDSIIKPYEEWARRGIGRREPRRETPEDRQIKVTEQISRKIVIETMVRGWPSFYLDKEDRKVFDAWADKYRRHAWALIKKQCRKAGVAVDILLEDNVIYEVKFNDNLGCTVQPLMLVDEATHAQLHGTGAGASAVVPLWSHGKPTSLPDDILRLGATNRDRATRLVEQARRVATGAQGDSARAAGLLRMALACHPAAAGKLILEEWSRRIGRDTGEEFQMARSIIVAKEMAFQNRYAEAKEKVKEYLDAEPNPVPDAYVILALNELVPSVNRLSEFKDCIHDYNRTLESYKALRESLEEVIGLLQEGGYLNLLAFEKLKSIGKKAEDLTRLRLLGEELERLGAKIEQLKSQMEKEAEGRRKLINKALSQPEKFGKTHPELALAVQKAHDELLGVVDNQGLYKESEEMFRRYGDIAKIIEVREIFDILYALLLLLNQIGKDPNKTRRQSVGEMQRLSQSLWISEAIKSDLKMLAEEFGKGEWDRLQANTIRSVVESAVVSCHSEIQGLLNDRAIGGLAMKEALLTRIHVMHILDSKYNQAFDALVEAKVPFGIAISTAWTVLNYTVKTIPEQASFRFDAQTNIVSLDAPAGRLALIQCKNMTDEEAAFVAAIINDPNLPFLISPFASCVAAGLLAAEVEPQAQWRLWRDAMIAIRREMLLVLSDFGYEACLMPEHSPPLAESIDDFEERMNHQVPRQAPSVDWAWQEMENWQDFIGAQVKRIAIESGNY
jgi:tetratricopeptide (TPR) repeat protein